MSNVNFIWSSRYSAKRGMVENKSVISFSDSLWEVLICTKRTLGPMWHRLTQHSPQGEEGGPFSPVVERNSSNHWKEAEYQLFLHSTPQCPRFQRIWKVAILFFYLRKSELKGAVGIEVRWDACLFSESDACIPALSQNSSLERFQLCVPLILYQAALSQARKVPWKGSYDILN